jgi:HlyD family secretion protein
VFVAEARTARLRRVELGHRGREAAEVLGGVEEGASVVLYPSDRLADGVRIASF